MTAVDQPLSHHPAPQRDQVSAYRSLFTLFGGPLAWFLQLSAGFALATQPCFADNVRIAAPAFAWSWSVIIAIAAAAAAVCMVSTFMAWRDFARTKHEHNGEHHDLLQVGAGRSRFLALWGICFGTGSLAVIVLTAVSCLLLPRCGG